jgi:hypothetical protein
MDPEKYAYDEAAGGWYPLHAPEGAQYLGNGKENCMADGVRSGRTVSFTTAVYCEMLRAYTVKSDSPVFVTFFRNNWMHLACGISAILTIAVSIIPGVNSVIFSLNVLHLFLYGMAIGFALLCVIIDELYKIRYRAILVDRAARIKNIAHKQLLEERFEVVVELLERHTKLMDTQTSSLKELKLHVHDIEKAVDAYKVGGRSPSNGGSPSHGASSRAGGGIPFSL